MSRADEKLAPEAFVNFSMAISPSDIQHSNGYHLKNKNSEQLQSNHKKISLFDTEEYIENIMKIFAFLISQIHWLFMKIGFD